MHPIHRFIPHFSVTNWTHSLSSICAWHPWFHQRKLCPLQRMHHQMNFLWDLLPVVSSTSQWFTHGKTNILWNGQSDVAIIAGFSLFKVYFGISDFILQNANFTQAILHHLCCLIFETMKFLLKQCFPLTLCHLSKYLYISYFSVNSSISTFFILFLMRNIMIPNIFNRALCPSRYILHSMMHGACNTSFTSPCFNASTVCVLLLLYEFGLGTFKDQLLNVFGEVLENAVTVVPSETSAKKKHGVGLVWLPHSYLQSTTEYLSQH